MFEVTWSCHKQCYMVFKDGRYLITTYDSKAAKSYLECGGEVTHTHSARGL